MTVKPRLGVTQGQWSCCCATYTYETVTLLSPLLAQEFVTICQSHYDKLFPLLLSNDSRRLICTVVRLIANFRLLVVLFSYILLL